MNLKNKGEIDVATKIEQMVSREKSFEIGYVSVYIYYLMEKNQATKEEAEEFYTNSVLSDREESSVIPISQTLIDQLKTAEVTLETTKDFLLYPNLSYFTRNIAEGSTSYSLADTIYNILNDKELEIEKAADFGSGYGSTLMNLFKLHAKNITGIEVNQSFALISHIRMSVMSEDFGESKYRVLIEDIYSYSMNHPDEKYDVIISNMPWGMRTAKGSSKDEWQHPMFEEVQINRNSEWKDLALLMSHLSAKGTGIFVGPPSLDYRAPDKAIRQYFIENGFIEKIISLPNNILYNTGIAPTVYVLSFGNKAIEFIDGSEIYTSQPGRLSKMTAEDIEELFSSENKIVVSNEEVLKKQRLSPSYYQIPIAEDSIAVDEFAEVFRGTRLPKEEQKKLESEITTNIEFIRMRHLGEGMVIGQEYLTEVPEKAFILKDEDIIISRVASNRKIVLFKAVEGVTSIADDSLLIIRCDKKQLDPYYVYACLNSDYGKAILEANYKGSVIQQINLKILREIPVPNASQTKQSNIRKELSLIENEILDTYVLHETAKEEREELVNNWFKEG